MPPEGYELAVVDDGNGEPGYFWRRSGWEVLAAADALADAASKPCNCFDGQLDWAYKQHNEPASGIDDCPVQAAVDAYRKARGDA